MHDAIALKKPLQKVTGALYDNATLFGGRVRLTTFGRFYDSVEQEEDWTFTPLQKPADGKTAACSLTRHLPTIAKELGVRELLVPSPRDFNARVCRQEKLTIRIPVGDRLVVKRGTKADGCRLLPGQGYAVSSAGCPTIIAWYPGNPQTGDKVKVDVAHAGLDSLIDREEVLLGSPSRKPTSVTENMLRSMNCLGERGYRRKRVQVVIAFSIPWQEFEHRWDYPGDGEDNEKLCKFLALSHGKGCLPGAERRGCVDLAEIATQQFVELGVPIENIKLITCEYLSSLRHTDGKEVWYSTRGEFKQRRNGIFVTRYA